MCVLVCVPKRYNIEMKKVFRATARGSNYYAMLFLLAGRDFFDHVQGSLSANSRLSRKSQLSRGESCLSHPSFFILFSKLHVFMASSSHPHIFCIPSGSRFLDPLLAGHAHSHVTHPGLSGYCWPSGSVWLHPLPSKCKFYNSRSRCCLLQTACEVFMGVYTSWNW